MPKYYLSFALFSALALQIGLVVNVPAQLVYDTFLAEKLNKYPIKVSQISGTLWSGSGAVASSEEFPLLQVDIPRVHWRLATENVLKGQIGYIVGIERSNAGGIDLGGFTIEASYDGELSVDLSDNNGPIALQATLHGKAIKGKVALRRPNPQLQALLALGQQFIGPQGDFSIQF